MERKELKTAGLTDEQIDTVMKLSGQDTNQLKSQLAEAKATTDTLNGQIKDFQSQLDTAKKDKTNSDELNTKISDLQTQLKDSQSKADAQLKAFKKNSAIEVGLLKAGTSNIKALKAGLDLDKISLDDKGNLIGLNDQIDTLKKDDAWAPLFPKETHPATQNREHNHVIEPDDPDVEKTKLQQAFKSSTPLNRIEIIKH
ncbi:MAG: phage scaffolding protein [Oenococcus sp.]|uniref:phage scaffolding protein n=1 Tax=Oenococcus sp. TaxID=1979414 RepID=UPI0039E96423